MTGVLSPGAGIAAGFVMPVLYCAGGRFHRTNWSIVSSTVRVPRGSCTTDSPDPKSFTRLSRVDICHRAFA